MARPSAVSPPCSSDCALENLRNRRGRRSADGDAQDTGWTAIPGATSRIYTPADGDSGHYLRVTASYTDAHGPSKSASAALSVPVAALGISERYDSDGDGSISLSEALQAASDYRDGVITYDEAIAVANLYFESYEP